MPPQSLGQPWLGIVYDLWVAETSFGDYSYLLTSGVIYGQQECGAQANECSLYTVE